MLDYSKYFDIETKKIKLEKDYQILVIPIIKTSPIDEVGEFILEHKERFEYLVKNYWSPRKYKIETDQEAKAKYFQEVAKEFQVNQYIDLLITSILDKEIGGKIKFKLIELKRVASRFFFCKKTKKNNGSYNIRCYICIGKNGQTEANWPNEYKLLEAISYEAILKSMITTNGSVQFSKNLKEYLTDYEEIKQEREIDKYVAKVRANVYKLMEKDKSLEETLMDYYKLNKDNIPMEIL